MTFITKKEAIKYLDSISSIVEQEIEDEENFDKNLLKDIQTVLNNPEKYFYAYWQGAENNPELIFADSIKILIKERMDGII
ncbi:hypothetical protein LCGC14_0432990 [marine sediment metagenome]|uniref:Uncharacterized protein n=1 Tax=marine sediment metagenome TaxID=412755 RepID=A0A0F9STY7_9ZZZZ